MKIAKHSLFLMLVLWTVEACAPPNQSIQVNLIPGEIYPQVNDRKPDLPSPFVSKDGQEFVVAVTKEQQYAVMPVTLSDSREICRQLIVDTADFPQLAQTGLHAENSLNQIKTITGRTLEEITELRAFEGKLYEVLRGCRV